MLRWFNNWQLKVASTLILISLLIMWIGPEKIWRSIYNARPQLLAFSLVFTPVVIGIKAVRWQLLAKTETPMSYREALQSYLAGLTLAVLTPLAAGEIGRSIFTNANNRIRLTGKVILDKMIDLVMVIFFSGISLMLTPHNAMRITGLVIFVGALITWIWALIALPKLALSAAKPRYTWLTKFHISTLISGLANTPRPQLLLNMALPLIGFVIFYFQAYIILLAFWQTATLTVIPYFPIITLNAILPIAFSGIGIREWTAVLLLKQFGIPNSVAFNTFFIHFIIVQLIPAIAGAAIISSYRRSKPDVKHTHKTEVNGDESQ